MGKALEALIRVVYNDLSEEAGLYLITELKQLAGEDITFLTGCAYSGRSYVPPAYTVIKPGDILQLNEPITIAPHSASINMQYGKLVSKGSVDQYHPSCNLRFSRWSSDHPAYCAATQRTVRCSSFVARCVQNRHLLRRQYDSARASHHVS